LAATTPPEVAPVRAGEELDWDSLERYLRTHLAPTVGDDVEGEFSVLQFPNGSANLTYLVRFGDSPFVVRRPPFGAIAPGAHDMHREYRALSKLWQRYPKAPRAFLFCDDHSVIGADFLVMEYRSGEVIWATIPDSMAGHDDVVRRVGMAVVDALAELHLVEPRAVGLDDLGRPDGFVGRQLAGWSKRWELAAPAGTEPLMETVGKRLAAAVPSPPAVAVLHNDFKIDNCQFDPTDPDDVKSVFDWDMATLGDPFVDLGTLLNYWPDPADTDDDRPLHYPGLESLGLPGRDEVVARYASVTGFDVADVYWYEAFACWKTAVVLQQLYIRYVRGESTDPRMATRGEKVGPQARRAMTILDRAGR
jgi:aminoglycoside phosphotransferase (APT) family kinase protein